MASTKRSSTSLVVVDGVKPEGTKKRSRAAERPGVRKASSGTKKEEIEQLPRRLRGMTSGDDLICISRRLHDRLKGVCAGCYRAGFSVNIYTWYGCGGFSAGMLCSLS